MSDLSDFLLARIAEDEAKAREANGRVAWLTLREPDGSMRYTTVAHQQREDTPWLADGHEIEAQDIYVFYDSARVLAECAANRLIVQRYIDAHDGLNLFDGEEYDQVILPARALPYADHPDYRSEWRP